MSTSWMSRFKELFKSSSSSPSTSPPPPPPPPPSSSPSTPPPPPQEPFPPTFLCPITGYPMVDPIIIHTGDTFDRVSIEACRELNFTPPELSSRSIDFSSHSLTLIPNLALKSAINHWYDSAGRERPSPCSLQTAKGKVERAMSLGNQEPSSSSADDILLKEILTKLKETPIPLKAFLLTQGSGNQESSSAAASAQEPSKQRIAGSAADNPAPSSSSTRTRTVKNLEKKILRKTKMSETSKNESGLANLIQLITMESPDHYRVSLCTPRIVAVLIPMLQSPNASISLSALEAIYTFSLTPSNRIKIVQCGTVPHLVDVLTMGVVIEARGKAASAIYNLAISEENRMAIGASGNLPGFANSWATIPLLYTAINYDKSVLREGIDVPIEVRKCAVILLYCLVGTNKEREILMQIRIVSDMLRMVRKGEGIEVHCLAVLYNIFLHDTSRFRCLAINERAEDVFAEMKEAWGEDGRELARRMLGIIRGN